MGEKRGLSRDTIKYFAMFVMLLNHIAAVFLTPGTLWYEIFTDLGYFTAITMCYFLVEGYSYTHSKKKYGLRLLIFGFLSEIPYCLALTKKGWIDFVGFDMIFTLFFCFLLIYVYKEVESPFLKADLIGFLILATLYCDWAVLACVFTLLFLWAEGSEEKRKQGFLDSMGIFGCYKMLNRWGTVSFEKNLLLSLGNVMGIGLSAVCILYFYNGKRMKTGKKFSKWFFYLFYPLHLLILGIIRIMTGT